MDELAYKIAELIRQREMAAYKRGLSEGASRLDFWGAIVPGSMTKKKLIAGLNQEADMLYKKAEG